MSQSDTALAAKYDSLYVLPLRLRAPGLSLHEELTFHQPYRELHCLRHQWYAAIPRLRHRLHLIAAYTSVLIFYEYALTIEDERILVWQQNWTATTVLFLLNRFVMMFMAISQLLPYTYHT